MSHWGPTPETLERVKHILRRDLILGTSAPIADDMPLFGGEFDLDSIDALLLDPVTEPRLLGASEERRTLRVPLEPKVPFHVNDTRPCGFLLSG